MNQAGQYKSAKILIFAAGGASIFVGILAIVLYSTNKEDQTIMNILKMIFFVILGVALIGINIKKAKFVAECESGAAVVAQAPGVEVPAQVVAPTQPQAMQYVQPQTQVVAQQVPVQTQPVAPVQTQVVPQQVPVAPTQVAKPQAMQPAQPKAPAKKSKIVQINCPKCKGAMQINTAMLGQKIKCPHCGVEGRIG
jgi:ribosomal protein S27E